MKIFFDLDGPILDVSQRYYSVFLAICKGNTQLSKEEFWDFKRKKVSWPEILKEARSDVGEKEFMKYWMRRIEMKKYLILDKIQPYTKSTLNSLRKKYILYLISLRQSKKNLLWQIKRVNIDKYFKKIMHCKYNFDKPWEGKAELIKEIIESQENTLIVGDTEVDIRASKLVGIKSVGIANGIRTKELLLKEKPDFLISDINEILQIMSLV